MTPLSRISESCTECLGRGYVISGALLGRDVIPEKASCPTCKGRGIVLSWEGKIAKQKGRASRLRQILRAWSRR